MAGWEQTGLERDVSRRVGAAITRVVSAGSREVLLAALPLPDSAQVVEGLGGAPVTCPDMRLLADEARSAGRVLVVDNTLATSFGSSPARRGGNVVVERLGGNEGEGTSAWAVSLSRDARSVPGLREAVATLPRVGEETQEAIRAQLPAREEERRLSNDEAALPPTPPTRRLPPSSTTASGRWWTSRWPKACQLPCPSEVWISPSTTAGGAWP